MIPVDIRTVKSAIKNNQPLTVEVGKKRVKYSVEALEVILQDSQLSKLWGISEQKPS